MNRGETGINPELSESSELSPEQYQNIKEEFLKPFSDEEIDAEWKLLSQMRQSSIAPFKELQHRSMDGFDFAIHALQVSESRFLEFQITDEAKNYKAKIIFDEDQQGSGKWELTHRLINTDKLGITGTEFLHMAENYLESLAKKGYIKLDEYLVAASQTSVVSWLTKNEYQFSSEEDKDMLYNIMANPEDYELFYISNGKDGYLPEPFIFQKSAVSPDELTRFLDPEFSDNKHLQLGAHKVTELKGLARMHLEKIPKIELAKPE